MAVHVGLGWVPAGLPGKPGQVFCLFWCSMHMPLFSWLHDVGWDCGMLESHRNIVWYSGWHVGSPILKVADRQSAIYELYLQTNLNGCFEGFSLAWLNGDTLLATGGGHLVEIGIGANRRALNDAELENTRHMYESLMIHWSGLSLSKMIRKWVLCNIIRYMSCKWQTHTLFPHVSDPLC